VVLARKSVLIALLSRGIIESLRKIAASISSSLVVHARGVIFVCDVASMQCC
jgi:hypothetical protein